MGAKNTIITWVWIDQNVSNGKKKYKTNLSSIIGLEIKPYDNNSVALEYLETSNRQKFYEFNKNNKFDLVNHSFFNSG